MGQRIMMPANLTSYPYEVLRQRTRPTSSDAPEANVDVLYDTQAYPAAGVGRLSFFNNVNADLTLSNMELAGVLPADVFFDVHRVFVDFLGLPTATVADTAAGALTDVATVLNTARGTFTFTSMQKPVGPIPLSFLGNSGAPEGMIGSGRAAAAGAVIQVARMPDNGGWPANGTIRLGPQTKFSCFLDFVPGIAISAQTNIRISLLGVRYRRIG